MKSIEAWGIGFLSVANVVAAGVHAFHQRSPFVWLMFTAILAAAVIMVIEVQRLQRVFPGDSGTMDNKAAKQLRSSAFSLWAVANLAIMAALSFVPTAPMTK